MYLFTFFTSALYWRAGQPHASVALIPGRVLAVSISFGDCVEVRSLAVSISFGDCVEVRSDLGAVEKRKISTTAHLPLTTPAGKITPFFLVGQFSAQLLSL